ncbi:MAG TPA: SIMPL domain-containing protein [Bellilinea sp.]|nr:SIMPL domain-containing protein [Bellilinea sp.]
MRNKIFVVIAGLIIVGLLAACQGTALTNNGYNQIPMISVSGTGKVYVAPDIANVYLGVRSQAADVGSALSQNNAQATAIASTLQEQGVAAEDIQTTAFNVYPQQNYNPDGTPMDTVYVVENTVYIKVRNLTNLGGLLDSVIKAGANTINGINFGVEDSTAAEAEARKLAVEDAKAKAQELATLSGVTLGDLFSVNVYSLGGPQPVYEAKGGAAAQTAGTPIAAGQLVIQMEASMTYAIK